MTQWLDDREEMVCDFSNRNGKGMEMKIFQKKSSKMHPTSVAKETYITSAKLWAYLGRHFIECIVILEAHYLFKHHKLYTSNSINQYILILFYCIYQRQIYIHFDGKQMFLHKKNNFISSVIFLV